MLINKYEQEIQELKKQLSENEEYFNNEEKNRIKEDNEIKRYEQEIQELKKQLNDYKKTEKEKIYDNIPYLETKEEAAENIADIYERKENKARTFAPKHNVKKDNKARTFAPKHNVKKKYDFHDFDDSDIEDFNLDNKKKIREKKNIIKTI